MVPKGVEQGKTDKRAYLSGNYAKSIAQTRENQVKENGNVPRVKQRLGNFNVAWYLDQMRLFCATSQRTKIYYYYSK